MGFEASNLNKTKYLYPVQTWTLRHSLSVVSFLHRPISLLCILLSTAVQCVIQDAHIHSLYPHLGHFSIVSSWLNFEVLFINVDICGVNNLRSSIVLYPDSPHGHFSLFLFAFICCITFLFYLLLWPSLLHLGSLRRHWLNIIFVCIEISTALLYTNDTCILQYTGNRDLQEFRAK